MGSIFTLFKDNKPYTSLTKVWIAGICDYVMEFDGQGKVIKSYYDPIHLEVMVKKAYLYSEASEDKKTKVYVVKGDKVKIVELDDTFSWIKIEYQGVKRTYRRWIKIEAIRED